MNGQIKLNQHFLFILTLLPIWGVFQISTTSLPVTNDSASVIESTLPLITSLERAGFEVSPGYLKQVDKEDCAYSFVVMGSCFLNNPAAPYVIPIVPTWPDEWLDPATVNAFGPTEEGYSASYRLDPREAIVILGQLPPPARYFGLQSYLLTRQGTYDESSEMYLKMSAFGQAMLDTFFHTIPANPKRIITFDSLSNANNHVVIEQQSGAAFNQLRYFVITPDKSMDQAVRKVLGKAGVASKDIFTEPIPSNMRTGLAEEADEFMTLIRYAEPENEALADEWRNDLPLVVLRVRPSQPDKQPVAYKEVKFEKRRAVDEFELKADLDLLEQAIFEKWGQTLDPNRVYSQIDFQSYFDFVGPLCEKIGMDCLADTQDAAYQAKPGGYTLDFGEIYAYIGVLGTRTGNATYVGLGINNALKKLGVHNVHDYELLNSATIFDDQVNNTDKLFVHYFARNCTGLENLTGGYCSEITPEMIPICTDPTGKSCVRVMFTERDYTFPGSRRGPDSTFILPGRTIKLLDPRA